MRNVFLNAVGVCAMLSLMASCSSTEDIPTYDTASGVISLNVITDTQFESRAVNESDYEKLGNYTVQIYKDGNLLSGMEWKYEDVPDTLELSNGGYELKAFCGEDKAISTSGMYVEGTKIFNVNSDQSTVSVTCRPVCGRVKVEFGERMAEYFNDYSVSFQTMALVEESGTLSSVALWKKTDTDPMYMKVSEGEKIKATINLTDKKGKTSSILKEYELSPCQALKIKLMPAVSEGDLGITIEVDENTNDIPVDIEIPSEWVDMKNDSK